MGKKRGGEVSVKVTMICVLAIVVVLVGVAALNYFQKPAAGEEEEESFCTRTIQVQVKILDKVQEVRCDHVKPEQLANVKTGLDLSREGIDSLKPGDFNNLTGLKLLHVNYNDLHSLPLGIFDDLTSLDTLGLAENKLSHLPPGVFDNMEALKNLDLQHNNLTSLRPGVFDKLHDLEQLVLRDNSLDSLPPGIFENLHDLRYLDARGNPLECIPREAFGSRTDDFSRILIDPLKNQRIVLCPS